MCSPRKRCLQTRPKTFEARFDNQLAPGVTSKDLILYLIGQISTSGGTGYVLEYTGEAIRTLSMEQRMTICNMSIEGGARAGLIAPDDKTIEYIRGRENAPADFDAAIERWNKLPSDEGAVLRSSRDFRCLKNCTSNYLGHESRPSHWRRYCGSQPSGYR